MFAFSAAQTYTDSMLTEPLQLVLTVPGVWFEDVLKAARWFSMQRSAEKTALYSAETKDIQKAQNGDAEAYRRLIERHQAAIGKLLWRFTRDRTEHEELVQQVFVEAYMSLNKYAGKAPFEHWLARIATRVGYHYWTRNRRDKAVWLSEEQWKHFAQPPNDSIDSREAAELVHRLLSQLPPRDRLVLTLRYLEQCEVAQIAYRLGWTQTRVRVQLHRAIQKLKGMLADKQIELEL
jgi:RNA polymerase sigma-70 factor (ECF subfamily)